MKITTLELTRVAVFPLNKPMGSLKAYAKLVLNDSFILNGIKVVKGKFGHFVLFPKKRGDSSHSHYEPATTRFRKEIQNSILHEYAKTLTQFTSV